MMKFTLPRATERDDVSRVLRREGFAVRTDAHNPQAIHTDASADDVSGAVVYVHSGRCCADCGMRGETTGHQDCQYPQDHG